MYKPMLDYIKKRKKKAGGVQGRPTVDCRVVVLSQTQREGLVENVFYWQRPAIVFYGLM